MSVEDYCELCDLPESQCIHGQPPPPPKAAPTRTAPRAPRAPRTTTRTATAPPARSLPRRWTPPEVFKPVIVAVLQEAGGELEQDDVFAQLEERMAERLTAADHETTPEGELRWRYAARRARQALIAEGEMTKGRPGVWSLA
jgi:hypothetical protein